MVSFIVAAGLHAGGSELDRGLGGLPGSERERLGLNRGREPCDRVPSGALVSAPRGWLDRPWRGGEYGP